MIYKIFDNNSKFFLTGGSNPRWTKNGKNFVNKREAESAYLRAIESLYHTLSGYWILVTENPNNFHAKEHINIYRAELDSALNNWELQTFRLSLLDSNSFPAKEKLQALIVQLENELINKLKKLKKGK